MFSKLSTLKISALLADNLSYYSYNSICNLSIFNFNNYKEIIDRHSPHLVLIESVWGSTLETLKFHCEKKKTHNKDNIFDYCSQKNIPTVFWCKEDPISTSMFLSVSSCFDYVFTIDFSSTFKYKNACHHDRVYQLSHAINSNIFNPTNKNADKLNTCVFAGTWYSLLPSRQKDMRILFDGAKEHGLDIYNRNSNSTDPTFAYPDCYKPFIKNEIPFYRMGEVYKKYNVVLNTHTVSDSNSYYSIRTFEALACGINMVSTPAPFIKNNLSNIVKCGSTSQEIYSNIFTLLSYPSLSEQASLLGIREAFTSNTYEDRFKTIINKLNISDFEFTEKNVVVFAIAQNRFDVQSAIRNFNNQSYSNKELVLFLANHSLHNSLVSTDSSIKLIDVFNANLNELIINHLRNIDCSYIAYFDTKSSYGSSFLLDCMNAFKYSDAQIVGKCNYYAFDTNSKILSLENDGEEFSYCNSLNPCTLVFEKSILSALKSLYPAKAFLDECVSNNKFMYSIDKYNFVQDANMFTPMHIFSSIYF